MGGSVGAAEAWEGIVVVRVLVGGAGVDDGGRKVREVR